MYTKTCEGCGELFEAVKRNKKWCTDLCGRRTRRRGAALGGRAASPIPVVNPVANPVLAASDMVVYVRENLAWARAVNPGVVLPVDVVDGLLSDDDGGVGSEADYALVQQVLVSSAVARLQGLQSGTSSVDDVLAGLRLLTDFLDDLVSPRIVAALAASL